MKQIKKQIKKQNSSFDAILTSIGLDSNQIKQAKKIRNMKPNPNALSISEEYTVDWAHWLKQVTEHPNDFTKEEIAQTKEFEEEQRLGNNRDLVDFAKGKKTKKRKTSKLIKDIMKDLNDAYSNVIKFPKKRAQ
tara:strand:- start:47 stop:448 length:402 start_codon:yes stop_codon:yes gene_type:complete